MIWRERAFEKLAAEKTSAKYGKLEAQCEIFLSLVRPRRHHEGFAESGKAKKAEYV